MRTITTKVYTFDELTDEAKAVAIEKYRESEDFPFLSDDMHERLGELLIKYKMKSDDAHVFYSLSYSQGDGAMFTGTIEYKSWLIEVSHWGGMYYHFNSKTIDSITSIKTGETPSDKVYSRVFHEFEPLYVKLCKELEQWGYDYIESATSDEVITDTLMANEYEYTEDGRMV